MSETKKMTREEILEVFKSEYNSLLRRYERKVEKYAAKMNEDYEYFFRWYGDEMYIAQVNLRAVKELNPVSAWDDCEKIKMWLSNHIENLELTLIEGNQYARSSSIMANTAEVLGRVAKQQFREDLQRLLRVIEYEG